MKYLQIAGSMAIMFFFTGCATTYTTRLHPTLEEQLKHIDSVVVTPPRVEIEYVTLTGENERLPDQEDIVRAQLVQMAQDRLTSRGYEVMEFDFDSAMESNDEFAYTITQIREGFEKAKEELQLGKGLTMEKASELKISIGEAVNIVAEETGADAILIMRFAGFDKSKGYVAKDVGTSLLVGILTMGSIIPISTTDGAITEVALVDGATGDVLWADIMSGKLGPSIAQTALSTLPPDVDPAIVE